jgi:ElaB/YqjD/DUF883 family membrane-anchored ribosome-binding protein
MKNKNYIKKYLIIILPLLFINLNAQDQVDPLEKETAAEETESTEAAAEKATAETEETERTEVATEEVEIAEEADEVEEFVVKEKSGFSIGVAPSIGLVKGATFTNVPMGATLVITTPYGFKLGPLDFTISAAFGGYQGEHAGDVFNPTVMGVGGNLTLANFVFTEGHAGIVGEGTGIRGFAGVSLDYLMKKGLGLPVNILVGGEGFITTSLTDAGNTSGWGGLGVRLDYDF